MTGRLWAGRLWDWLLRCAVRRVMTDGARSATVWLDDPQGQSHLTRVKIERDWKQP